MDGCAGAAGARAVHCFQGRVTRLLFRIRLRKILNSSYAGREDKETKLANKEKEDSGCRRVGIGRHECSGSFGRRRFFAGITNLADRAYTTSSSISDGVQVYALAAPRGLMAGVSFSI